jgi:hypothetical protein
LKLARVGRRGKQRLGHHQGVLRVVADHASCKNKIHAPTAMPAPGNALRRKPFGRQPERISHRSAHQHALDLVFLGWKHGKDTGKAEWRYFINSSKPLSHII